MVARSALGRRAGTERTRSSCRSCSFDPDVFVPTLGSLLAWKHLFTTGAGAGKRCLDVGCGSGLLAVQLALNGAEQVHAIDIQRSAVANTLANAFRNGVADRVSGAEVDLYMVEPERRYDLVVASLYQMPVDPFEQAGGHRPLDYWGRNLVDHLLQLLPRLLDDGGAALVMQLSIVSRLQTEALLAEHGLTSRVVDYSFFPFTPLFERSLDQIERVEELLRRVPRHARRRTGDGRVPAGDRACVRPPPA